MSVIHLGNVDIHFNQNIPLRIFGIYNIWNLFNFGISGFANQHQQSSDYITIKHLTLIIEYLECYSITEYEMSNKDREWYVTFDTSRIKWHRLKRVKKKSKSRKFRKGENTNKKKKKSQRTRKCNIHMLKRNPAKMYFFSNNFLISTFSTVNSSF